MLSQTLPARQQKFVCAFAPLRSGVWQQGCDFRYSVSSKNMTDVRTLRCPGCGEEIPLLPSGECQYSCPLCHSTITFSRRRLLASYILGFVLSLAVTKLLRLTATEAPLWILIFIPSFIVATLLTALVMSPYEVCKYRAPGPIARNIRLFLGIWFAIVALALTEGYVFGWLAYLIGSRQDVIEGMDLWAVPLGFVNSAFVVRPEKDLVEVIGIVSANGYFWALALTLIFKFVHSRLRRNRVTELAISGSSVEQEDDGL